MVLLSGDQDYFSSALPLSAPLRCKVMTTINIMYDTPGSDLRWSTIYESLANSTATSAAGGGPYTYTYSSDGHFDGFSAPYQIRVVVSSGSFPGFPPSSGTITAIQFWDTGGNTELAEIAGLSVSAAAFESALAQYEGGASFPFNSALRDTSGLDAIFLTQSYSATFSSASYVYGGANVEGGQQADTLDFHNALAGVFRINGDGGDDVIGMPETTVAATGGSGADRFQFADLFSGSSKFVMDFDHGNTGVYSSAEGDTLDVSALVASAYNRGAGQSVASLVRIVDDKDGAFAKLQVDTDGTGSAHHWTTAGNLVGFHQSETANVRMDSTIPVLNVTVGLQSDVSFTGDFNADGKADLFWRNDSGSIAIWSMNGAQVTDGSQVNAAPDASWHAVGIGDFNGDHASDILWRNNDGQLAVWAMNGPQINAAAQIAVQPDHTWHIEAVADFNSDGKGDVLWRNDTSNAVVVWTMNGNNITSSPTVSATPTSTMHVVGAGDFNHDGLSDILWRDDSTNTLTEWIMNGGNVLTQANIASSPDASWHIETVADFSGDGRADILWRNDNNSLALWTMNGNNIVSGAAIGSTPDSSWHVAGAGDYNGDGKADILWRNDNGSLAEWHMNGAQILSGPQVGSTPDQTWAIQSHHFDFV